MYRLLPRWKFEVRGWKLKFETPPLPLPLKGGEFNGLNNYALNLLFLYRFAGEVDAEFLEDFPIYLGEHYCGMNLTAFELRECGKGFLAPFVALAENAEGNEHLVGMQTRIATLKEFHLGLLYRLYHNLRNEFHIVVDACKILRGIEKQSSRSTQKR